MKSFNISAAQGEVNIRRIKELPESDIAGLVSVKSEGGMFIVGHSESGHHHGFIDQPGVTLMERTKNVPAGMKILYAVLEKPTALVQDASNPHSPIIFDAGIFALRIAREYDAFAEQARRVAD